VAATKGPVSTLFFFFSPPFFFFLVFCGPAIVRRAVARCGKISTRWPVSPALRPSAGNNPAAGSSSRCVASLASASGPAAVPAVPPGAQIALSSGNPDQAARAGGPRAPGDHPQ